MCERCCDDQGVREEEVVMTNEWGMRRFYSHMGEGWVDCDDRWVRNEEVVVSAKWGMRRLWYQMSEGWGDYSDRWVRDDEVVMTNEWGIRRLYDRFPKIQSFWTLTMGFLYSLGLIHLTKNGLHWPRVFMRDSRDFLNCEERVGARFLVSDPMFRSSLITVNTRWSRVIIFVSLLSKKKMCIQNSFYRFGIKMGNIWAKFIKILQ